MKQTKLIMSHNYILLSCYLRVSDPLKVYRNPVEISATVDVYLHMGVFYMCNVYLD